MSGPKLREISEALICLYEPIPIDQFPQQLFQLVESLVPGTKLTFDKLEVASGTLTHIRSYTVPDEESWLISLNKAIAKEHPAVEYVARGGRERVLRLSDFVPRRRLRETFFYNEVLRPQDTYGQIAVLLPIPGCVAGVTLNRDRDFRESEMDLMRLLEAHILRAHANSLIYTALQSAETAITVAAGSPGDARKLGLTDREAEVLYWMAQGKRDREIGVILDISHKTVGKHVEHILAKLGAETRGAAAAQLLDLA
jgi:DNA-binding CsgD family transcriptional regulator